MNLGFGASLAYVMGVLLPVMGVVRNWTANDSDIGAFFADLLCGGLLLFGAVKTGQRPHTGQRFLSAAWGLTVGIFYASLMQQLQPKANGIIAVEGYIPEEYLIVPTIVGLLIALVGLMVSLRSIHQK
jgi:hypothetical protein